jgi:uncharacterized protein YlxP (DUF503 family)
MKVGLLTLQFHLPIVDSLKGKRSVVKKLLSDIQRLGPAFAAAEVAEMDNPRRVTLRVAHVSNDPRHTTSVLTKLRAQLENRKDCVLERFELETL